MPETAPPKLTGACGCGAVTYRLASTPMFVHCCHCTECQRQTGSAYVINALIEADRVEINGETSVHQLPTPSGKGQIVTRCAVCGTAICSNYMIRGDKMRFVRVGTLDTPSACTPNVQIFTADKQDWVPLSRDIPSFQGFYKFEDLWSEAALARRRALFSKET